MAALTQSKGGSGGHPCAGAAIVMSLAFPCDTQLRDGIAAAAPSQLASRRLLSNAAIVLCCIGEDGGSSRQQLSVLLPNTSFGASSLSRTDDDRGAKLHRSNGSLRANHARLIVLREKPAERGVARVRIGANGSRQRRRATARI